MTRARSDERTYDHSSFLRREFVALRHLSVSFYPSLVKSSTKRELFRALNLDNIDLIRNFVANERVLFVWDGMERNFEKMMEFHRSTEDRSIDRV